MAVRHDEAVWRMKIGDTREARGMLEKVVEDRRRMLGANHPDTVESIEALAACDRKEG